MWRISTRVTSGNDSAVLTASLAFSAEAYSKASLLWLARFSAICSPCWSIVLRIWRLPCHEVSSEEAMAKKITPTVTATFNCCLNAASRK